jgi:hypothetical protein
MARVPVAVVVILAVWCAPAPAGEQCGYSAVRAF